MEGEAPKKKKQLSEAQLAQLAKAREKANMVRTQNAARKRKDGVLYWIILLSRIFIDFIEIGFIKFFPSCWPSGPETTFFPLLPTLSRRYVWFFMVPGNCWWLLYLMAQGEEPLSS